MADEKKKGIIYEVLNEVKSLDRERTSDGLMHLSGVFGVCGVRNNNQRVYETKNYAKMVESMQERLKKAPIAGELEHPQTMNITTENISHRIDSIKIDENGVVSGEITLLNTPKGKIAQAIVEGGLPLFISSRAQGQVDRNGNVTLETLQTYDLVGSPGFSQAELHLNEGQTFESITESIAFVECGGCSGGSCGDSEAAKARKDEEKKKKLKEQEDMDNETLQKIQERIEDLEDQIADLQEQNTLLQEQLDEKAGFNLEQVANGIQSWIVEEFAPEVQNWVVEEFAPEVQNWICEEYSETLQKWVVEEFAPEVQNWIVEHYSPEIQKWAIDELCPEIQNWIVEEYSQGIQGWIQEHARPEIENKLSEKITESFKSNKVEKLQSIDSVLTMLEEHKTAKPVYGRKANMVAESDEPRYIQEMPTDKRVKWNMASQDIRESIQRRASLYDFSREGAIQHFWESIDFDKIAPIKRLNEDLNNITDEWEKRVRASIRGWHKG